MQSIYSQFYDSRSPFVPEVYKKWASTEPSYMSEASDHSEDENVVVVKKLPWRSAGEIMIIIMCMLIKKCSLMTKIVSSRCYGN